MSEEIPAINLAAIETRTAMREARQMTARQDASKARFIEDIERGFNPEAAEREQGRYNKFKNLETRRKPPPGLEKRITEVDKKAEEDLAQNYSRRNPELPANRLRDLLAAIKQGQTAEEIFEEVNRAFPDATLADEAYEYLEKLTDGDIKKSVQKARDLLNELKGREVIAGRNVDTVAKAYHKKGVGQNPSELRELYRSITGTPRDHNTLFSELSKMYTFDQLKLVVAFLLKGLAFDLKSKGPSIAEPELMRLMTDCRNLQSLLWVYLFFKSRKKTIQMLYDAYGLEEDEPFTFEQLAQEFVKLVEERYPSVMKILKRLDKLGKLSDLEKIIVLMQYRDGVRQLSPRLYKSNRHRQDVLLVLLESLEELEERTSDDDEEEE